MATSRQPSPVLIILWYSFTEAASIACPTCVTDALAFEKQSSATQTSSGNVSTWRWAWDTRGDFETEATEFDRFGAPECDFRWGEPCDGGRLTAILGLIFDSDWFAAILGLLLDGGRLAAILGLLLGG